MQKERRDPGNGFAYVGIGQAAATVLNTVFWLILILLIRPEAYGLFAWSVSIAFLVSTVCVLGLGKTIATYYPKEENEKLLSTSVFLVLAASIVGGSLTVVGLAFWAGSPFAGWVGSLVVALSVFSLAFYSKLAKREYKKYMWTWLGARSAGLAVPIALFYVWGSVAGLIGGMTISYFLFGGWVLKSMGKGLDFREVSKRLDFSIKTWFADVGRSSMNFFDEIFIGVLFPFASLGVYHFGYRIFLFLAVLPNSLFFYLLPEKSSGREEKKIERIGILVSAVLALLVYFLSPFIISYFIEEGFSEGIRMLRIMGFAVVPYTLARIKSSDWFSKEEADIVLGSRLFGLGIGVVGIIASFNFDLGLVGLAASMLAMYVGLLGGYVSFPKLLEFGRAGKIGLGLIGVVLAAGLVVGSISLVAPQMVVDEGGYLFRIEGEGVVDVVHNLNEGNVAGELRGEFSDRGYNISRDSSVIPLNRGEWYISNDEKLYKIEKGEGHLDVSRKIRVRRTDPWVMDTVAEIQVFARDEETGRKAVSKAYEEIYRIERLMNVEDSDSEIYELNNQTGWVDLSPETVHVLKMSKKYGEITRNRFDVTAKPLVDFWMKGVEEKGRMPTDEELKEYFDLVNLDGLKIDEDKNRAKLEKKGMAVTLGGIAKGYAIDRASEVLKEEGVKESFVRIGGDIRVVGKKPWNIGIQDPRQEGKLLTVVRLENESIHTSGDYRRYHLLGEERIHHIIDPTTGRPATKSISATVIADNNLAADALSTGVFVLGPQQGKEVLDEIGIGGLIVDPEGEITTTKYWDHKL